MSIHSWLVRNQKSWRDVQVGGPDHVKTGFSSRVMEAIIARPPGPFSQQEIATAMGAKPRGVNGALAKFLKYGYIRSLGAAMYILTDKPYIPNRLEDRERMGTPIHKPKGQKP